MIFAATQDKPVSKDKTPRQKPYTDKSLFEVLPANQLLSTDLHKKILKKLQIVVGVPDEYYQALYVPLINAFAEYAQLIPAIVGGPLGSMLNYGLARSYFAVDHFKNNNPELQNHLHTYMLFSAFLLKDIGRLACGRFINICTGTGEYLSTWRPFESSMLFQGEYYRIRDKFSDIPDLYKRLTPILAQKLMPGIGFLWIAESEDTLDLWFALMEDLGEELPHYGMIYEVAQTYAVEYFSGPEFLLPLEVREARELMHGENFFEWLKHQLATGELTVNHDDSLVHEVDKGLLIDVDALEERYEKYNGEKINKAIKEFERIGLTYMIEGSTREMYRKYSSVKRNYNQAPKLSGFVSAFKSSRGYMGGSASQKIYKGLVLKDKSLVSYKKPAHAASLSPVKGYGLKGLLTGGKANNPAVVNMVFKNQHGK